MAKRATFNWRSIYEYQIIDIHFNFDVAQFDNAMGMKFIIHQTGEGG